MLIELPDTAHQEIDQLPPEAAAGKILSWRDTLRTISLVAEAEVMAACFAIRRAHPDRERFEAFTTKWLKGTLTPARAWLLADLWAVAKEDPGVRGLTFSDPRRAIDLMRDFTRAIEADWRGRARIDLDADTRKIAELMLAPTRGRTVRMRKFAAEVRAARAGRNPDDVARIAELEAERAAADTAPSLPKRAAAAVEAFARQEAALVETAREIEALCAAGALSRRARGRLLLTADMLADTVDAVAGAVRETNE